ncbi:MAG: rhomboid family intramembrane serine protease [Planctomycetes bacterium]|nr:rhomboid family intramembrane serine protease [Planctomycetota bacterium]
MLPIRDNVRRSRAALVVVVMAVLCALVFVREMQLQGTMRQRRLEELMGLESPLDRLMARSALVPEKVAQGLLHPGELLEDPGAAVLRFALPLFTSLFLHASLSHLLSNLWFLWIFGRSVESLLGPLRALATYLVAGVAAGLIHVLLLAYSGAVDDYAALHGAGIAGLPHRLAILANEWPGSGLRIAPFTPSRIPTIGASGAISGLLGAYLVLCPRAIVTTVIPPLIFLTFDVPAVIFIAFWMFSQIFGLWDSMSAPLFSDTGGIAYGAHFGGFVVGLLAALLLRRPSRDEALLVEIR